MDGQRPSGNQSRTGGREFTAHVCPPGLAAPGHGRGPGAAQWPLLGWAGGQVPAELCHLGIPSSAPGNTNGQHSCPQKCTGNARRDSREAPSGGQANTECPRAAAPTPASPAHEVRPPAAGPRAAPSAPSSASRPRLAPHGTPRSGQGLLGHNMGQERAERDPRPPAEMGKGPNGSTDSSPSRQGT